jgi:hypothetical protein
MGAEKIFENPFRVDTVLALGQVSSRKKTKVKSGQQGFFRADRCHESK